MAELFFIILSPPIALLVTFLGRMFTNYAVGLVTCSEIIGIFTVFTSSVEMFFCLITPIKAVLSVRIWYLTANFVKS